MIRLAAELAIAEKDIIVITAVGVAAAGAADVRAVDLAVGVEVLRRDRACCIRLLALLQPFPDRLQQYRAC